MDNVLSTNLSTSRMGTSLLRNWVQHDYVSLPDTQMMAANKVQLPTATLLHQQWRRKRLLSKVCPMSLTRLGKICLAVAQCRLLLEECHLLFEKFRLHLERARYRESRCTSPWRPLQMSTLARRQSIFNQSQHFLVTQNCAHVIRTLFFNLSRVRWERTL